jgi:hypothetical protein
MSSLWTPGGEHEVPRNSQTAPQPSGASSRGQARNAQGGSPYEVDDMYEDGMDGMDLTPEEEAELRAMQEQLISVPAASVIANHVVNIFQLGMLHLFSAPPSLEEAALAIDAASAIVEKLDGRLGPDEQTLVDAVHQMRMAYVQVRNANA